MTIAAADAIGAEHFLVIHKIEVSNLEGFKSSLYLKYLLLPHFEFYGEELSVESALPSSGERASMILPVASYPPPSPSPSSPTPPLPPLPSFLATLP